MSYLYQYLFTRCAVFYDDLLRRSTAIFWSHTLNGGGRGSGYRTTDRSLSTDFDDSHPAAFDADKFCRLDDQQLSHVNGTTGGPRRRADDARGRRRGGVVLGRHLLKAIVVLLPWLKHSRSMAAVYSAASRGYPEVEFIAIDVLDMCLELSVF